jgi:hypothetical protein
MRFARPPTPWTDLTERRAPFRMTTAPQDRLFQQRGFPGNQGDIGGGGASPLALNDIDAAATISKARGPARLLAQTWPSGRRRIKPGLRRNQTVDRGEPFETIHLSTALRVAAMEAENRRHDRPNLRPFLAPLREAGAALPLYRLVQTRAAGRRSPGPPAALSAPITADIGDHLIHLLRLQGR